MWKKEFKKWETGLKSKKWKRYEYKDIIYNNIDNKYGDNEGS